jgi:hypothetical protein
LGWENENKFRTKRKTNVFRFAEFLQGNSEQGLKFQTKV